MIYDTSSFVGLNVEGKRRLQSLFPIQIRNSLSNSPCPLGRARGRGRCNLLAHACDSEFFQKKSGPFRPFWMNRGDQLVPVILTGECDDSKHGKQIIHGPIFCMSRATAAPGPARRGLGPESPMTRYSLRQEPILNPGQCSAPS